MPAMHGAALVLVVLLAQSTAQPLNWAGDDGARVETLKKSGVRTDGAHVVLWTPAGALSDEERRELVRKLDLGVPAVRRLVGRHPWQVVGDEKITYYVSSDRFISHATARGVVFIPLARVQDGRAPFFHEVSHEYLAHRPTGARGPMRPGTRPLWLMEGLADVIGQSAAGEAGLVEGDVFDTGGLAGVDRVCATRLREPIGQQVVRAIGENAELPALFTTDRQTVAPTFYACSFSFTKFLVGKVGLGEVVALMPLMSTGGVPKRIEQLTHTTVARLREDWLRAIGATDRSQ
jgi:hypothetical protein